VRRRDGPPWIDAGDERDLVVDGEPLGGGEAGLVHAVAGSTGGGDEGIGAVAVGVAPIEGAAWHVVGAAGDGFEVDSGGNGQVGARRQPAYEPVAWLVERTLHAAVRGSAKAVVVPRRRSMTTHSAVCPCWIPGEGALACLGDPVRQADHAVSQASRVGAIGHRPEQGAARGAVHDRDGRRGVGRPDDQVAFEIPDVPWAIATPVRSAIGGQPHNTPLLLAGASSPAPVTALVVPMSPQLRIDPVVPSGDRLGTVS
jgi:hypothetical protein